MHGTYLITSSDTGTISKNNNILISSLKTEKEWGAKMLKKFAVKRL